MTYLASRPNREMCRLNRSLRRSDAHLSQQSHDAPRDHVATNWRHRTGRWPRCASSHAAHFLFSVLSLVNTFLSASLVLLNKQTLADLGVRFGDLVQLGPRGVSRAFPHADVASGHVAIPASLRVSLSLSLDEAVTVTSYGGPRLLAASVDVQPHGDAAAKALATHGDLCSTSTSEQLRAHILTQCLMSC